MDRWWMDLPAGGELEEIYHFAGPHHTELVIALWDHFVCAATPNRGSILQHYGIA